MKVDFEKTTPATHKQCLSLLARVRSQSASWPGRWSRAKAAGDRRQMNALLKEAEGLAAMEKTLMAFEIKARVALLDQDATLNSAAIRHTKKKIDQPCFSFKERLAERGRLALLEDFRKEIERKTVKLGIDYLTLAFREAMAGGASR